MAVTFNRQFRTPSSEVYALVEGEEAYGHLHLHFGATEVAALLVLFTEPSEEELGQLVEQIDEDLVLSADTPREDLLLTVYSGKEIAFFTDDVSRPIADES